MQPTIQAREGNAPFPVIFRYSPENNMQLSVEVWDLKGNPHEGFVRFDDKGEVIEHDINIFLSLAEYLQQRLPNPHNKIDGVPLDEYNTNILLGTATTAFRAIKKLIAKSPKNNEERFFNMIYVATPSGIVMLNPMRLHSDGKYYMLDPNGMTVIMENDMLQIV